MEDWVIIGGGIQGMTVAVHLIETEKASAEKMTIIDPHDKPLAKWKQLTGKIDMPYLRSAFVHHLSSSPFALEKFGKKDTGYTKPFLGRYNRPKLSLFNEHCEELFHQCELHKSWVKGSVNGLTRTNGAWSVSLHSGEVIKAAKVVLAIGLSGQLHLPPLFDKMKKDGHPVNHIFDESLDINKLKPPVAIIGGGITAAHTALKLSDLFPGQTAMLKRHPFRVHNFDSDPGWLGPKNMHYFTKLTDYKARRSCIHKARHRGSLTRELYLKLQKQERRQLLTIKTMNVSNIKEDKNHQMVLTEEESDYTHTAHSIICCTGFQPQLPGGDWLKELIASYSLPCAQCGYPIVDRSLMWTDNLYVTGALAELEIGPVARNISGAQKAASRIASAVK